MAAYIPFHLVRTVALKKLYIFQPIPIEMGPENIAYSITWNMWPNMFCIYVCFIICWKQILLRNAILSKKKKLWENWSLFVEAERRQRSGYPRRDLLVDICVNINMLLFLLLLGLGVPIFVVEYGAYVK